MWYCLWKGKAECVQCVIICRFALGGLQFLYFFWILMGFKWRMAAGLSFYLAKRQEMTVCWAHAFKMFWYADMLIWWYADAKSFFGQNQDGLAKNENFMKITNLLKRAKKMYGRKLLAKNYTNFFGFCTFCQCFACNFFHQFFLTHIKNSAFFDPP
jgi:hypothetical protein